MPELVAQLSESKEKAKRRAAQAYCPRRKEIKFKGSRFRHENSFKKSFKCNWATENIQRNSTISKALIGEPPYVPAKPMLVEISGS